jgi:hypothetical protein
MIRAGYSMSRPRNDSFAAARDTRELRMLRIRIEDKGPIAAFRWRGVTGDDAALARLKGLLRAAR